MRIGFLYLTPILSIDDARLDHVKVTLPEYVLLAGGLGQPMRTAQDYFSLASR
jgi:hypothetical protein